MTESILLWFQAWRTPAIEQCWLAVTDLGELHCAWVVIAALFCLCGAVPAYRAAFAVVYAHLGSIVLKGMFHVPRPWIRWPAVAPSDAAKLLAPGPSLPSAHSAQAAATFIAAALAVPDFPSAPHPSRARRLLLALALAVTLVVATSRLALGVHTPLDVLVGFLLGLAFALLAKTYCTACDPATYAARPRWHYRFRLATDPILPACLLVILWYPRVANAIDAIAPGSLGPISAALLVLPALDLAIAIERNHIHWNPADLALGWRLFGFLLVLATYLLWMAAAFPLFLATFGEAWGLAFHQALLPFLLFNLCPFLLRPLAR